MLKCSWKLVCPSNVCEGIHVHVRIKACIMGCIVDHPCMTCMYYYNNNNQQSTLIEIQYNLVHHFTFQVNITESKLYLYEWTTSIWELIHILGGDAKQVELNVQLELECKQLICSSPFAQLLVRCMCVVLLQESLP